MESFLEFRNLNLNATHNFIAVQISSNKFRLVPCMEIVLTPAPNPKTAGF